MRLRTTLACAAVAAALTGGLLSTAGSAAAAPSGLHGDFNGDGYRDIAIAAPDATVGGKYAAGRVGIVYGTSTGLNTAKRTVLSQNSTGIPGSLASDAMFGMTMATGDLNNDGYADLAVGSHDTAAVTVLWGGSGGVFGGTSFARPGGTNPGIYGRALAIGDFDGDGKRDLATAGKGAGVAIIKGGFTKSGTTGGITFLSTPLDTPIGPSYPSVENLTAGDVNKDGRADLVVQGYKPYEEGASDQYADAYLYTATEPGSTGVQLPGSYSAAIGDIDHDGYGDLALGNFAERAWDPAGATGGKVTVLPGSATGVDLTRAKVITQATPGVPGTAEADDRFGHSLTIGDTNADGYGELVIGSPGEDEGTVRDTGTIVLLRGSATGLTTTGAQAFTQNTAGVPSTSERNDFFGSSVLLTDINRNGRADLIASAVFENAGAGYVWTLRGATNGLTTTNATFFGAGTLGFDGEMSLFGRTLG